MGRNRICGNLSGHTDVVLSINKEVKLTSREYHGKSLFLHSKIGKSHAVWIKVGKKKCFGKTKVISP